MDFLAVHTVVKKVKGNKITVNTPQEPVRFDDDPQRIAQ